MVGARAELVRAELLELVPSLSDPEQATPLALYCRSVAREELGHEAIEGGNLSPKLLESVTAAARVARELGDALGIGPRAAAELRQIRAETAATVATLLKEAPTLFVIIDATLDALGLAERSEEFRLELARQIGKVTDDDQG